MALNPTGIMSIGGPVVGSSINLELGLSATANSSLNQANFRTLAGIPSGVIALSNFYGKSNGIQQALFVYGLTSPPSTSTNVSNKVSNTGVVSANTPGVGTSRRFTSGNSYGDKGIVAFGTTGTNNGNNIYRARR
jgi:hypothetical protein